MPSELHELLYYIEAQDETNTARNADSSSKPSGAFTAVGSDSRRIRNTVSALHQHSRSDDPTPDETESVS